MAVTVKWLFLTALVLVLHSTEKPVAAQAAVIQCHDKERGVVQPKTPDKCDGEILSREDAAKVKAELRRERIRRANQPKSEREQGPRGHGTGFFVSADGKIVTNNHVIAECRKTIWVDTTDGQQGTAVVLGADPGNDLALLASTLQAPAVAVFRSPDIIAPGSDITVIGYGTTKLPPIRPHVTPGTFQSHNTSGTRFQMRAAVRPGNSGGPVLDDSGYVAGVVFAQLNTVKTFQARGELILDQGFAISNPVVFGFLSGLGVDFRRAPARAPKPRDAIFQEAKPFIARISCPR
ncbi:MAG: serine protease [Alphaproteobacteria bacterium]